MSLKAEKKSGHTCKVPGCIRAAVAVGLCGACYQWEIKWAKRTPAQRDARQEQLSVWQRRFDRLTVSNNKRRHLRVVK